MSEIPKPRLRRTPEQARELILDAAQARLAEHGVRGLAIKDIASDTGINHGTLLHHFGSAEEMRTALLMRMTNDLIEAMSDILQSSSGPVASIESLFELMSSTGHIKLLAWRAMEENQFTDVEIPATSLALMTKIVDRITEGLSDHDQQRARNMVLLAVSAAVGWGVCGEGFQQMFGLSKTQQDNFPHWVGQQIEQLNRLD